MYTVRPELPHSVNYTGVTSTLTLSGVNMVLYKYLRNHIQYNEQWNISETDEGCTRNIQRSVINWPNITGRFSCSCFKNRDWCVLSDSIHLAKVIMKLLNTKCTQMLLFFEDELRDNSNMCVLYTFPHFWFHLFCSNNIEIFITV